MISVLILTLNEETALPDCLESLKWCDDVVVFDSFSSDHTLAVAQTKSARVFQRKFDNYAKQRNAALQVQFKYPWVLMLDADERVPEDLRDEMLATAKNAPEDLALLRMRRKDYFMGKWIKRSSGYPTWFGRLLRVGRVWVERDINEEYHTDGHVGLLKTHLHHYPFLKGVQFWIERHNRYSTMEADALTVNAPPHTQYADFFSSDPAVRRKVAKRILYRMPLRPVIVLAYLLFLRGVILDGRPGISFAVLRAMYEFMIDLKIVELSHLESRHKNATEG